MKIILSDEILSCNVFCLCLSLDLSLSLLGCTFYHSLCQQGSIFDMDPPALTSTYVRYCCEKFLVNS